MEDPSGISMVCVSEANAAAVARLHICGISEGFISSLGERFVRYLYQGISESDDAFGFVAVRDEKVLGFIACAESVGAVYRQVLKKHFLALVFSILPKLLHWRIIKNAAETLLYPVKAHDNLPRAEILSIVVGEEARGTGVGKMLMAAALEEFRRRGIAEVKVMVGEWLPANEFYKKVGFTLRGQYRHHGYMLNAYVKTV